MLYWLAVASSIAVIEKLASPSTSTTIFSGAATLAPMAEGRPKPIVPSPPDDTHDRGSDQR
jgi:hypothetical protein